MTTVQSFKTDVSSVRPSSEGMEELWVVCLSALIGATLLVGNYKATTKKKDITNIVNQMSVGDQKTRTISKVERMTKILIIIINYNY